MEVDKSIFIQKQVKDNSEDIQREFLDLKNWEAQMKRKERELLSERSDEEVLPSIRKPKKKPPAKEKEKKKKTETEHRSQQIKSCDYKSWDKFDVDKACKEVDNEGQSDSSSEEAMSKEELEKEHDKANQHKQEGNRFVQRKEWGKAIASYSEAIKIFPYDATFYANRALCYLKQDNLYSAEADCSSAIQLDEFYIKAYHRRATARMELKQYKEAKRDIEKILTLEPSNKETQVLLIQVNKRLESSKPIIIPEQDLAEDIPVEKRIGKKMLGNMKPNKEMVDAKEEVKKNRIEVDPIVKQRATSETASATESKLISRGIPEWLPERDDVAIVQPIKIPPHLRSKVPFKKIFVQEADLTKPFKREDKASRDENHRVESSDASSADIAKCTESVKRKRAEEEESVKLPSAPKTAVQFFMDWQKYTSFDLRYRYLKQITPGNLPGIFQDAMESYIFSDILATLKIEFMKRKEPVFSYLKALGNVRRFRTFVMFLDNSEKQDLKLIFSYCKTSEEVSEEEVAELRNRYEV